MKPNAKFRLTPTATLASDELQSLTLLYQPIVGPSAFSLYMALLTLPEKKEYDHHFLLQVMGYHMDQLVDTRQRLEAVGLLDVYKADNGLSYKLKKPLIATDFFSDGIMSAFLYVKIGTKDFLMTKQLLLESDDVLTGEKVSKRFDEVFDIAALARAPHEVTTQERQCDQPGIRLDQSFDEKSLVEMLIKKGISREIITPKLLNTLNELAFLYKFDVHELARLVFDSTEPIGTVNTSKMKALARTQFQLMSKGHHVEVVVKDPNKAVVEKLDKDRVDDSRDGMTAFLAQNPIDFLRFKSGGKPPVPADVKLVEWLYVDQQMDAGVVNVLIDYVLKHTDGRLPKQLVEKIAGEWQRQNIATSQAAMEKVIKTIQNSSEYKSGQKQPVAKRKAPVAEAIPGWFGKENEQPKMSREEAEAARQRMEQMRSAFLEKTGDVDEKIR
ncbi:MAG: DnaD domain protein [Turicibacter sp.]|nr:DnaD domain protein [Turicibacter sp.]